MKKIIFTSLFLLFTFFMFAQQDTLKTKGKKAIPTVIGKWQLDSISGSAKKISTPHILEFIATGDYTETIMNVPKSGKWKMENGMIIRDDTQTNSIENLTIKKMVLSELENKKKVFYYFGRMDYKSQRLDPIVH